MKLASFLTPNGTPSFGVIEGDKISDLSAYGTLQDNLSNDIKSLKSKTQFSLSDIRFLMPLHAPQKILCVGVNYANRNEEYKDGSEAPPYPSLFVRFPTSFTGAGEPLIKPKLSPQLDYEGEIVLVIGKQGRAIKEQDAHLHVFGLTLANEGTIRDWVRHSKFNVTQGKNFDNTGALGPFINTEFNLDKTYTIETKVNGERRQYDSTDSMMFNFRRLIAYISSFCTLLPGDMILTGTPTGAGARFDPPKWLKQGDVIEISATDLGVLRNTVKDEV